MADLSGDTALEQAFTSGRDFHAETASRVFGVPAGEVTGEMRSRIKAMNYGLAYGLSAYGLSQQLHITPDEARGLMDEYFEQFGGIRDYLHEVVAQARRDGYTQTIMGRRRYLPDLTSDNRQRREMAERMALNAPIQGSAADIIKVAMLRVDQALRAQGLRSRMLLQVHDELLFEVAEGELDALRSAGRRDHVPRLRPARSARRLGRYRAQLGRRRATRRRARSETGAARPAWEQRVTIMRRSMAAIDPLAELSYPERCAVFWCSPAMARHGCGRPRGPPWLARSARQIQCTPESPGEGLSVSAS